MNTKQQLHQTQLQQWAIRFQEQCNSGLTVKAWCTENNLSIHTYNYWKHLLKQEYIESVFPEIVPVLPSSGCQATPLPNSSDTHSMSSPLESRDSRELHNTNSILITINDIRIDVGSSVSEERLMRILKAVRYA
jgi:hypothetical protein